MRTAGTGAPSPPSAGPYLEGIDDERGGLYRADARGEVVSAHRRVQAVVLGEVACAGDVVEEDRRRDPVILVQRRVDVAAAVPVEAVPVGDDGRNQRRGQAGPADTEPAGNR